MIISLLRNIVFEEHQGKKIKIGVKVVGNMYGKPTKRMIAEAVNITEVVVETATEVQVEKDGMKEELQDQDQDLDSEMVSEK